MLNNLQLLRAFAAINVVLFHIIGTSILYQQEVNWLKPLQGWGISGVDLFFVISGFVMVYTQFERPKSPVQFLRSRFYRILPLYWVLTLLIASSLWLMPSVFRAMQIDLEWFLSSLFLTSQAMGYAEPMLYVGWTLELEMLFYGVFALALFARNLYVSVALVSLVLGALAWSLHLPMMLEFILGMLAGVIYRHIRLGVEASWWLAFLALVALLLSIGMDGESQRFVLWGIPSFLLVMAVLYLPQNKNPIGLYLGAASYSIYLVQVFSIPLFYKLSSTYLAFIQPDLLAVGCLLFTLAMASLLYQFVEQPLARQLRSIQVGANSHKRELYTR